MQTASRARLDEQLRQHLADRLCWDCLHVVNRFASVEPDSGGEGGLHIGRNVPLLKDRGKWRASVSALASPTWPLLAGSAWSILVCPVSESGFRTELSEPRASRGRRKRVTAKLVARERGTGPARICSLRVMDCPCRATQARFGAFLASELNRASIVLVEVGETLCLSR